MIIWTIINRLRCFQKISNMNLSSKYRGQGKYHGKTPFLLLFLHDTMFACLEVVKLV